VADSGDDRPRPAVGSYEKGWHDPVLYSVATGEGLTEEVIRRISAAKDERVDVLDRRLEALGLFEEMRLPEWVDEQMLAGLDLGRICFYARPEGEQVDEWRAVPRPLRATFERLGVPDSERR